MIKIKKHHHLDEFHFFKVLLCQCLFYNLLRTPHKYYPEKAYDEICIQTFQ